ncbi:uncharacterized protein MONBRDRAFT_31470 [Monosiga brevicollis MX1]|uniref:Mannosyltransferase n=1 Tax=Monosiga brevicollis TaxID=81824 RepID=A9UTD8_MONBE|nr:uncharacterized protein MONBRDRAFT_31470 [Monosiga brevicollis MX1]EDQ91474.1 predicted protein [Monosiga brevicollis MX1]|eukprot:XP_001743896.1 hypothetical protein [Monosiga brevicollis MX1]
MGVLLRLSELIVLITVLLLVYICPFSKVEESFNTQAIYDIVHHGRNLTAYDHHEFPGVVPRTFTGALLVAPWLSFFNYIFSLDGFAQQLAARAILAVLVWCGHVSVSRAVQRRLGRNAALAFNLISAVQFHLPFYMSRTLPNTFALICSNFALAAAIDNRWREFTAIIALAVPLFRAELVVFAGPLFLLALFTRRLNVTTMLGVGLPTGLLTIAFSTVIDSWFWGRWLWPEGEVLWFNTVLNKSSEWGVMPPGWYFLSVLPRSLNVAFQCLTLSFALLDLLLLDDSPILVCGLAFLGLYSALPHKELRFVIYVLPLLNVAAGIGLADFWDCPRARGALFSWLGRLIVIGALLGGLCCAMIFSRAAMLNYPGGEAMRWLHQHAQTPNATLHACNLAAQSGVTRFLEHDLSLHLSKVESWTDQIRPEQFEWLIAEAHDVALYQQHHTIVDTIKGFSRMRLQKAFPPLVFETVPQLYIMQRISQ